MGLLDGLIIGAAAGVAAAIIGASAVTATAIGVATALVADENLWKKINTCLCSLREKTLAWLKTHETFATKVLIFTVSVLDKGRACVNRLRCDAVSENGTKKVFTHILSAEEINRLGLTEGEETSETISIEDL